MTVSRARSMTNPRSSAGSRNFDRETMINGSLVLATTTRVFGVPVVLSVAYDVSTNYVCDAEKRDNVDRDAGEHERPRICQQVDRPSGSRSTPARAVSQTFNSGGSSFTR
jgi:hypothetical protein